MLTIVLTQCPSNGYQLGKMLALTEPKPYVVGGNPEADIFIDAPSVLPNHLQIEFQADHWTVKRLDAAAVVTLDGMAVAGEQNISEGNCINMGGFEFTVTKATRPEVDPNKTWMLKPESLV